LSIFFIPKTKLT